MRRCSSRRSRVCVGSSFPLVIEPAIVVAGEPHRKHRAMSRIRTMLIVDCGFPIIDCGRRLDQLTAENPRTARSVTGETPLVEFAMDVLGHEIRAPMFLTPLRRDRRLGLGSSVCQSAFGWVARARLFARRWHWRTSRRPDSQRWPILTCNADTPPGVMLSARCFLTHRSREPESTR